MKKIFTLFAVAIIALSVNAQEKVLFENGGAYGNGATLTSENAKVVLGNDRTTKNYDVKLSTAKAYCAELFGQQVMVENSETGEMEEKTRVVYVVGNQNPKDGELEGDAALVVIELPAFSKCRDDVAVRVVSYERFIHVSDNAGAREQNAGVLRVEVVSFGLDRYDQGVLRFGGLIGLVVACRGSVVGGIVCCRRTAGCHTKHH